MRTPYRVPVNVRYINDGATVNNWTAISLDQVKTLTRRSAKEGVATPSLANTILFLKFVLFQYTSLNKTSASKILLTLFLDPQRIRSAQS